MTTAHDGRIVGALCGIAAAVLFGVTVPLAKLLLPRSSPVVLAGLLYLGAGVALLVTTTARWLIGRSVDPAGALSTGIGHCFQHRRFDTSAIGQNWTEICAYGTAVFAIPLSQHEPGATGQSIYLTNSGDATAQLKP